MSRSFARAQRAWGQGTFPWFELTFDPSAAVSGGGARWRPAPRGEGERKGEMQKPRNGFAALTTLRAPSLRRRFATPLSRLSWRPKTSRKLGSECGGPAGTRTLDQRIKSPLLYQLSYQPSYARRRNCFFGFIKRNRSRLNEDAILLRRSILSTHF